MTFTQTSTAAVAATNTTAVATTISPLSLLHAVNPSGEGSVSHTGSSPVISILNVHWCEVQADEILP